METLREHHNPAGAMVLALGFAMTFAACGQQAKAPVAQAPVLPEPPTREAAEAVRPPIDETPVLVPVTPPTPQAPAVAEAPPPPTPQAAALLSAEQLDKLVGPVALYPDPLLAQLLPASTYPLEVVQASRWAQANKGLEGEALEKAVTDREWAPSVKALCAFPDVLQYMDENLDWTTQLGDAVLGQEQDVLDAIQRMRMKAQAAGTLKSNDKQTVEVETAGDRTVVVIEPAQPEVIYVPTYDPEIVYYPSGYTYVEDWTPGFIGFGLGVAIGSFSWWWNDCDWYDRRIVYCRDYDDWWDHGYRGYHWRRNHRIDWDDCDWDRVDWRRCDRIRHGGRDIDIRHINIDNIDINRYDWRHADFRKFDWNRVDWRRVDMDRVDWRRGDWGKLDWGRAGIKDPVLVDRLKNLSPEDREWMRGRFDRARGNQQYKDLLAKAQLERGSPGGHGEGGGLGSGIGRWEHDPKHRRGVAYRGPAKDFPALLEQRRSGGDGSRDGVRQVGLAGSGIGERGSRDSGPGGGFLGGLRERFGSWKPSGDKDGDKGKEAPRAELVKRTPGEGFSGAGGPSRGRDEGSSNRILEALRSRGGGGEGGERNLGGIFSRGGDKDGDKGKEAPRAELVKRTPGEGFSGAGGPSRGRDEGSSNRILEALRSRGGGGEGGERNLGGIFSRGGDKDGDKGKEIPKATRVFDPPKTQTFRQPERGSSSSGDFSRMIDAFRQRGSDDRSRGSISSFGSRDRDDDKKSSSSGSSSRSFSFSKRPEPPKEFRSPSRSGSSGFSFENRNRDSGRSMSEMFKRGDSGRGSGDSNKSSFSRSSGSSGSRSIERKSPSSGGGGFKFEGHKSSRSSSGGDRDRGGGDRDRGRRDKD